MNLIDALEELAALREDEIFEEILPELATLCRHRWLLKLLLHICDTRNDRNA